MKKHWLTAALLVSTAMGASAQTLFTYGSHKVSSAEFLKAYNKNNQQLTGDRTTSMREYLQLYINSRLRIQEAYDRRFDTLPQVRDEVDNLRSQIIENFMSDPDAVKRLSSEAFDRSQKDIHVAHIFIASEIAGDTAAPRRKLAEVQKRLAKGDDFASVARELSDDPSAAENGGDLHYITVFTLPYQFENAIYKTAPGKYSATVTSQAGYHIFKNIEERKAAGKLKLQQILLAFPPGSGEEERAALGRQADSLYQLIQKGSDFARLASAFSNDNLTAHADGNMTEVAVGQYDYDFETKAWPIPDGSVAPPFATRYGYHIVKKIAAVPVVADRDDKANNEALTERVMNDDRWKTAKDFIYSRVRTKPGYKKMYPSDAALWAITDSLVDSRAAGIGRTLHPSSSVFTIGDTTLKVSDWSNFVQMNRYRADRTTIKDYPTLMDEFSKQVMYDYYRNHLEDYNPEFRYQMSEFRDGNMFFEIMQQEVWNKAQSDSMALVRLYNTDKSKYQWKESAQAVIFFCVDSTTATDLAKKVKADINGWKAAADAVNEKVVADSSRFELDQIPGLTGKPSAGTITDVVVNPTDNTATFSLIRDVYPAPGQRSFAEAKGLVMNDYQTVLEEKWTSQLKKKYPVKVDEKELKKISKP